MRIDKKEKKKVLVIEEEVRVRQGDHDIILEEGDKIEVLPKKDEAVKTTRNGWKYDPHDYEMSGLPSLSKETKNGWFLIVITYDEDEREAFQVGEHSTEDWSVEWAKNFLSMREVVDIVQWRHGMKIGNEDLLVLMGE